jgi:hypothetical protein
MFNREELRGGWMGNHEPKRRGELRARDGPTSLVNRIVKNTPSKEMSGLC